MNVTQTRPVAVSRTSSDSYKPNERLDFWRSRISEYHDVVLPGDASGETFEVNNTLWNLGGLIIADASFSAHTQLRNRQKIRRSGADHYQLVLPVAGENNVFVTERVQEEIEPGQPFMTDLGQPEQHTIGEGRQIVAFFARDFLDERLRVPVDVHGLMPQGPLSVLLADHLRNLLACLRTSSAMEGSALADATAALVVATIMNSPLAINAARPQIHDALRRRIIAYVDRQLENPELSQDHLCRVFHLSRPHLYRLFRANGGVATMIQTRRLARIRQILETSGERHHLGVLSDRFAFSSQSQMSRAFRLLFGHAPRETQASLLVGDPCLKSTHAPTFVQWMQELSKSAVAPQ